MVDIHKQTWLSSSVKENTTSKDWEGSINLWGKVVLLLLLLTFLDCKWTCFSSKNSVHGIGIHMHINDILIWVFYWHILMCEQGGSKSRTVGFIRWRLMHWCRLFSTEPKQTNKQTNSPFHLVVSLVFEIKCSSNSESRKLLFATDGNSYRTINIKMESCRFHYLWIHLPNNSCTWRFREHRRGGGSKSVRTKGQDIDCKVVYFRNLRCYTHKFLPS